MSTGLGIPLPGAHISLFRKCHVLGRREGCSAFCWYSLFAYFPHLTGSQAYLIRAARHHGLREAAQKLDWPPSRPADTTCLALCNHRLLSVFAVGSLLRHRLPMGQPGDLTNERSLFLTRLSLDIPEYYLCSICSRLHLWRTFPPPALFKRTRCFRLLAGHGEYWWVGQPIARPLWPRISPYKLHFTHAQLALRRFCYGPKYGISTDSLSYIEVSTLPCEDATTQPQNASATKPEGRVWSGIQTFLMSCEARICPTAPSLCLRIQVWSVVNRQNACALLPKRDYVWFCGHFWTEKPFNSDCVRSHVSAYLSGAPKPAEYGNCSKCNTEGRIEVRDFGTQEVSLIITRWIDVGPRLSPQDPRWRSRIPVGSRVDVPAEDIVPSPRLRFEASLAEGGKSRTLSDEELCSRNASLLKGRRYMDAMEKIPATREWCMRPNSREPRSSGCVVLQWRIIQFTFRSSA